ncbi:unnamed protein product [Lota lota]
MRPGHDAPVSECSAARSSELERPLSSAARGFVLPCTSMRFAAESPRQRLSSEERDTCATSTTREADVASSEQD